MNDILYRCELHEPEQARQVLRERALPWVGEQLKQGRELVAEFRLLDDDITQRQRSYFHAVVLEEFHLYARPNGQQFPQLVWKGFLKERFLGFKVVTSIDPMSGKTRRLRHRVSTESLGIRGYAAFIDQCIAFAATDCGFEVSEPLPPDCAALGRERRPSSAETSTPSPGKSSKPPDAQKGKPCTFD